MKLNNKGWGMGQLLLMMGVMCIALLYVVLNSYKISEIFSKKDDHRIIDNTSEKDDNQVTIPRSYYKSLERKLSNAASEYVETTYSGEPIVKLVIEYSTLKQFNLIEVMEDPKDNSECDGYAVVDANNINSYIKCNNYKTEGY